MSLFKAEVRRLTKRRFTRWVVLGSLLVLVAVAIGTAATNKKVGPADVAAAQAQSAQDYQRALEESVQERQRCEAASGTPEAANYPAACSEVYTPTAEDFDYRWNLASTFIFRDDFGALITAIAAILALAAFVVGASYVGAEWNSGGMMNLLLWRPQRLKVLGTKLAALLAGLTALTVVVLAVFTAIFRAIAGLRGSTDTMTSGAWLSFGLMELRSLVLVVVAAAIGFGLASLGRNTTLALGAAVGAVVVFQFGLVGVLSMAEVPFAEIWLLPIWASAWLDKEVTLYNYNACDFSVSGGCNPPELVLTWAMAGGLMTAAVVLIVGAAMWTMRSRDVA